MYNNNKKFEAREKETSRAKGKVRGGGGNDRAARRPSPFGPASF